MSSIWTPGGEHPVDRDAAAAEAAPAGEPADDGPPLSPEEVAELEREVAAVQEELARTPVSVVVANHAVGLFQLAALHLNQRPPNLEEGRLAIDALAALVDGLQGRLGEQEAPLREALAQLRLAYVQVSGEAASS